MSFGDIRRDGQPARSDPNRDVGAAIAKTVDSDLTRALIAEGELEYDEARELADTIEADIEDTVRAYFEEGGA